MDRETFARNYFSGLFANWVGKLSNEFIIKIDMNSDDEELIDLHGEFVHELKDLLDRYSFDERDKDDLNNLMSRLCGDYFINHRFFCGEYLYIYRITS